MSNKIESVNLRGFKIYGTATEIKISIDTLDSGRFTKVIMMNKFILIFLNLIK
jgi:hypothetical protein